MPAIDIDREAAHQAAQRELAKPIYPRESPAQRFKDFVDQLLYQLTHQASSVPGGWFTITVLLIVLAVAALAAIRIARRTILSRHVGDHPLFSGGELSAAQHRANAERAAAEGDWAGAIRHRLRAVARGLEETGCLSAVPGRTANELAHDAGMRLPGLRSELSSAAAAFNDVSYGERPGTPAAYQMIADLDEHLQSSPTAGSPVMNEPPVHDSWAPVR